MLLHNQIKKLPRDSIISPKQLDSGIGKLKVVSLVRLQKILFVASTSSVPNRSPLPDEAFSSAVAGRLGGGILGSSFISLSWKLSCKPYI